MKSAFAPYEKRVKTIFERIKPGFAALRTEHGLAAPKNPYWDGNA